MTLANRQPGEEWESRSMASNTVGGDKIRGMVVGVL